MNILLAQDEECQKRINIDDLYETNFKRDMRQISIFNKLLNRIHKRITTTSRLKRDEKAIWFIVPEFIFGESTYNQAECIAYIVKQLTENGFSVRYIHPHTLFISWENWVPAYVRSRVKKQTGVTINEKGEVVKTKEDVENELNNNGASDNPDNGLLNLGNSSQKGGGQANKAYTPIGQYKPTGALLYNENLFRRINEKCGV